MCSILIYYNYHSLYCPIILLHLLQNVLTLHSKYIDMLYIIYQNWHETSVRLLELNELDISIRLLELNEFKWTPREANMAAHVLASWSLSNRLASCLVLGSAPSSFSDIILLEQATLWHSFVTRWVFCLQ